MSVQTRRRLPSQKSPTGSARVGRGTPPPYDDDPGRRPRRRTRRRDPLWARLTLILGAVLMMTSGVAIVGSKALISRATGDIDQRNLLGEAGKTNAEGGRNLDGPIDMLLLGVDARARWSADDTRADTIIILHIPATHDQAYLISVPRDTEAHIPAFAKSGYRGGTDKINAAFQHGAANGGGWEGGAQLMAQTIKKLTGISFDGASIINFGGFKGVIDALGSVRICVSQEVKSIHMSFVDGKPVWNADAKKTGKQMTPVVHRKGCREMEGWAALDYARQQNQQQLIKAMANKAMADGVMTNPGKVNQLIKAAGQAFILDTGGVPIADFIFTMRGVTANELTMLRTNNGTFAASASGREALTPLSLQMFEAVKEDKLAEFVYANPAVLSTRK
jgi:LCP family protein required for cell wall assembly